MKLVCSVSLAEQYNINPQEYVGIHVISLPVSTRVRHHLQNNHIHTLTDLLEKTPGDLNRMRGFGALCFEEVNKLLLSLQNNSHIDLTNEEEHDMKHVCSVSLAEQYNINPQEYIDIHVTSLPVSTRVRHHLQNNHIHTLTDLLEKTPSELNRIKGFGKLCFEEVNKLLLSLQSNSHIKPTNGVFLSENLIHQYGYHILQGDFSFINEKLTDKELEIISEIQKSYETLGADLVNECIKNPTSIRSIVRMFQSFCINTERLSEVNHLMKNIPTNRHQNLAIGYINAYTKDENIQNLLVSQYSSDDAVLGEIITDNLDDTITFTHVRNFLKWCSFDLTKDIANLINIINTNNKLQDVLEMRARKITLEKCGNKLNLTKERIRQLEEKILRVFARYQKDLKLIAKISAEKNGDTVVTPADIKRFSGEYSTEVLFLFRKYKNLSYTYDEQFDVFIFGDNSLPNRVYSFVENLPEDKVR